MPDERGHLSVHHLRDGGKRARVAHGHGPTGGTGAIIAEHAYHGSSAWLADLRLQRVARRTTASPRRDLRGTSSRNWRPGRCPAARRISAAADTLRAAGDDPALVLADLGFTSEASWTRRPSFLQGLIDGAHGTGALFLADEGSDQVRAHRPATLAVRRP